MPKSSAAISERSVSGQFRLIRAVRNQLQADEIAARRNENRQPTGRAEQDRPPVNEVVQQPQLQGEHAAQNVRDVELPPNAADVPRVAERVNADSEESDTDGEAAEEGEADAPHAGAHQEGDNNNIWEVISNSEEEESDHDEFQNNDYGNTPLYHGAPLTVLQSMTLVLSLMLNHNLTASCVADFLAVIQMHCLERGRCNLSYHKFCKFFSVPKVSKKKEYFCSNCDMKLQSADVDCASCGNRKGLSYFVHLPITAQLKEMFKRDSFYQNLHYRFNRKKQAPQNFEDIYDGSLYKQQVNHGLLSDPNAISFTWYTDSIPVYKSNNYSFWPFFLLINELPYKMRLSRENVILAGLWFGKKNVSPNLFLDAFVPELRRLFQGERFSVAGVREPILVKAIVIAGVADTPAKRTFMNFVGHNGFYGCPRCEIRGETLRRPGETNKHVYRYQDVLPKRTLSRVQEQATLAVNGAGPVVGVKGPSVLRIIMPDFIEGVGIDEMHIMMGIVQKLLTLHFSPQCSEYRFSLRRVIGVADYALSHAKSPSFIHRRVSSLEHFNQWKASELKTWFFYYSLPVYRRIMPHVYFQHYLKLVAAVSYLSVSSISPQMIDKAEFLLKDFVREFEVLYDLQFCSINIHLLLHLPDSVRHLGPLWMYSCLLMENLNGLLLGTVHGKMSVDSQICNSFWLVLHLTRKLQNVQQGDVRDFCKKRRRALRLTEQIAPSCYVIGFVQDGGENDVLIQRAFEGSNIVSGRVSQFYRLLKNDIVYISQRYPRNINNMSCYSVFNIDGGTQLCMIHVFVIVRRCGCDFNCRCHCDYYAIVQLTDQSFQFALPAQYPNCTIEHLSEIEMSLQLQAIPVSQLNSVCVHIPVFEKNYLSEPINKVE